MMAARRQRGVGMIEVLITLVVIAFGVLAHVNFQRFSFREANLSSGRTAATEVALDKLEDLRAYSTLKTTTGQFAFQDIANNVGGALAAGSVTVDNTTYTRNWAVVNYWYTNPNSAATTTAPTGNPLPSFKRVIVTIAWTDLIGTAQTLNLETYIAGTDLARIPRMYQ